MTSVTLTKYDRACTRCPQQWNLLTAFADELVPDPLADDGEWMCAIHAACQPAGEA